MKGKDVLFSSAKTGGRDDWETPRFLFEYYNRIFKLVRDIAASDTNHLCESYFTEKDNALKQVWGKPDEVVFCNPPYSMISEFVPYAAEQECHTLFLIPARPDTKAWQDYIFPLAEYVQFIRGRLHFGLDGKPHHDPAGFPSAAVLLGPPRLGKLIEVDTLDVVSLEGYREYKEAIKDAQRLEKLRKLRERESRDYESESDESGEISRAS